MGHRERYRSWDAVQNALREWMARRGVEGRLPTRAELQRDGNASLALAIQSHGGHLAVAQRMGCVIRCRAPSFAFQAYVRNLPGVIAVHNLFPPSSFILCHLTLMSAPWWC